MEKNETSCPKLVYEKIFRAITLSPAFTTIRRISNRQQTPSSAAAKCSQNPPSEVPIKFDYTTSRLPNPKPKTAAPNGLTYTNGTQAVPLVAQQAKTPRPIVSGNGQQAASKLKQHQAKKGEACKKPTQQHYDAKFDAFIYQTREKLMSDDRQVNRGNSQKVVGHGYSKDHHFSDFINKTKRKIRSTLSMKDRSESFFK